MLPHTNLIVAVLNQRLQQLHEMVHGLVSERSIVRLARFIQAVAGEPGIQISPQGACLRLPLPYYEIARSIGIIAIFQPLTVTYEPN